MLRINHISPFSLRPLILAGALLLLCLSSCSRVQSIREARTIVAEADSLRSAGQSLSPSAFHLSPSQSDSTTIASAVSALEPLHLIYPTAYAHANYYYGRLLREAGNQPEAMLAFLRVVHSRTKDHEIKARSWSNIANMCRLAADHKVAQQMYDLAAKEFLSGNDTLMYLYSVNNQAYEFAEMSEKDMCFSTLHGVELFCVDSSILMKITETKAQACIKSGLYDSALYYIKQTYPPFSNEPSFLLLRAQAYSFLGVKDSAVIYAEQVVQCTNSLFDLNNAYYILANEDATKGKEEALQCTRDRSDIQKLIEIRQGQLSQAVLLLKQDMNRPPYWVIAIIIISSLTIVYFSLKVVFVKSIRKQKKINKEVLHLQEQKVDYERITETLREKHVAQQEQRRTQVEQTIKAIKDSNNLSRDLCWKDYEKMCGLVNQQFFMLLNKLYQIYPLSDVETRLCVLVLLGYSNKQMAEILSYAQSGIGTLKDRTAKRFNTSGHNFLKTTALAISILGMAASLQDFSCCHALRIGQITVYNHSPSQRYGK